MPAELIQTPMFIPAECAKKVVSNSPGLVNSIILNLPDGQVKFFGNSLLSILLIKKIFLGYIN